MEVSATVDRLNGYFKSNSPLDIDSADWSKILRCDKK